MTEILGICGSVRRRGNTEFMINLALEAAEQVEGVRTKLIKLRELKIEPCTACLRCSDQREGEYPCPYYKDGDDMPYQAILDADGMILATPVYFGTVSSLLKTYMDRTEPFFRRTRRQWLKAGLRYKVGGALAVGHSRQGGQEYTIMTIHNYFLILEMIVVGAMSGAEIFPGPSFGAAGVQYPRDDSDRLAVEYDEIGIASSKRLGITVARVAKMIKQAKSAMAEEFCQ
jgi:multimeric flavodoxin WrbA